MSRIGQIFINKDGIETFLCINNYSSFLNPFADKKMPLNVQLYGEQGEKIVDQTIEIEEGGARAISVRELIGTSSSIGLATCESGLGNTQFFTYYVHSGSEAMAMIHPQSTMFQSDKGEAWRCCQSMVTEELETLSVYHANHAIHDCEIIYEIRDFESDEVLSVKKAAIPACSARHTEFHSDDFKASRVVTLTTDSLPSPNGKPLIMRCYPGQRFSMSHG